MTNTTQSRDFKIGEGVYHANDVADILKLPYHKVQYLMNSYWRAFTLGGERNKTVNFLALIEFYTFFFLREKNVAAAAIKKFHKMLSKDLKTSYPKRLELRSASQNRSDSIL